MIGAKEIDQGEQRGRVAGKYSNEQESRFWEQFAEKGLTDLEEQAVHACLVRGNRVLDIGCGCGREAAALEQLGMEVWALDLVQRLAHTARRRLESLGRPARVVCADASEGIPFSCDFDAAVLFEQVYQHIPDRRARLQCLENLQAALKPGGLLLLSAFNEGDVDLWARFLWMRNTHWRLATMATQGDNLLDSRYNASDESVSRPTPMPLFHPRRIVWVMAYLRFLIRRKRLARKALCRVATDERASCKALNRINPLGDSEGWFWFRVMAMPELGKELEEAGFQIEHVYPLLGERYTCSQRSARGAPLVLVVARNGKRRG